MSYFLIVALLCVTQIAAKDLGTFGATFTIQEEDLLVILKTRLAKKKMDEQANLELKKAFIKKIESPKGRFLPRATRQSIHEYDPTLNLNEDIKDHQGVVIASKGTCINPLDQTPLRTALLFFDGNDPEQLEWAKKEKGVWILTTGAPLEIENRENRPVYFDQSAYLTSKLNIKALPAKVIQEGKKLKVEEIQCL